ncbi:MAG: hypothetical protein OXE17_05695, partial [Chloroflexi bacterium]|nr:hypothetical protein [Chloroflexota bacterium]
MTTRMEKVAEDVALTALQRATRASGSPLDPDKLKETLKASWPPEGSQQPMNHALEVAAAAA